MKKHLQKSLVYLLLISFLINIPLPAFAQNNSAATVLTDAGTIAALSNSLPQPDYYPSMLGETNEDETTTLDAKSDKTIQITKTEPLPPQPKEPVTVKMLANESIDNSKPLEEPNRRDPQKTAGKPISAEFYNSLISNNRQDLLNELLAQGRTIPDEVYGTKPPVSTNADPEQDTSVTQEVYSATSDSAISATTTGSSEDQAIYSALSGPSTTNGVNNEQYSAWQDTEEIVSPQTGDLTVKQTDIKLPGRNGLDLNISRLYQSNQALWGDLRTSEERGGYSDYSNVYPMSRTIRVFGIPIK